MATLAEIFQEQLSNFSACHFYFFSSSPTVYLNHFNHSYLLIATASQSLFNLVGGKTPVL
jgi:hypothetical protein